MLKLTKSEVVMLLLGFAIGLLICYFLMPKPAQRATTVVPVSPVDSGTLNRMLDANQAVIIIQSNTNQKLKHYENAKSAYDSAAVVVLP